MRVMQAASARDSRRKGAFFGRRRVWCGMGVDASVASQVQVPEAVRAGLGERDDPVGRGFSQVRAT